MAMTPRTSRDLPKSAPATDTARDQQDAVVDDAGKDETRDRAAEHGDGRTIGLDRE